MWVSLTKRDPYVKNFFVCRSICLYVRVTYTYVKWMRTHTPNRCTLINETCAYSKMRPTFKLKETHMQRFFFYVDRSAQYVDRWAHTYGRPTPTSNGFACTHRMGVHSESETYIYSEMRPTYTRK